MHGPQWARSLQPTGIPVTGPLFAAPPAAEEARWVGAPVVAWAFLEGDGVPLQECREAELPRGREGGPPAGA